MSIKFDETEWVPSYRHWRTGNVLDQGDFPHCVGFSWKQWMLSTPIRTKNGPDPAIIYSEAQKVDEWPGEDYEGTSVRAGAKVLEARGHISSYVWATDPYELRRWILTKGPVVVGTWWYSNMSDPPNNGVLDVSGWQQGGHAYLITGYNTQIKMYRCINSWGNSWGVNGRFWVKEDDMHRLIFTEDGEACAAIERRI